jgi:exopolysaccharide biosynthesis polyprenyl glycosylphosphotransferase
MKKPELVFNSVSVPVDALMLLAAGIISFYSRLNFQELVGPVIYNLQLPEFLSVSYRVIPVVLLIFATLGLYNLKGTRRFSSEVGRIMIGISVALFSVIILFFFNRELFPSRFIILASWGFSILLVVLGRIILRFIQEILFKRGYGLHNLVIISGNDQEAKIIEPFYNNTSLGYRLVAEVPYSDVTLAQLEHLYAENRIDEIMQTSSSLNDAENLKIVEFARNKGLQYSFIPNLFDVQRNVVEVNTINGLPIIGLKNTPLDGWGRVAKRVLDIAASLMCILLTSPFFIIISIAIKLDSKGPVIYPALRGGRGRDFWFYKFRSMQAHLSPGLGGAEAERVRQELWQKNDRGGAEAPFLKIKNDPRITRVGSFIRKTKLDELPQFWNVLKGDMSMVGPRAHVLDEVERYRNRYRRMFSVKPGIFGLSQNAQIMLPELPFEEEVKLVTFYIENWSIWLDVKILARSFWLLFFAKKPKDNY